MRIIFFDAETNDLPTDFTKEPKQYEFWPRIIQLGWIVADETGKVLCRHSYLIQPDGWEIPDIPFYVEHGFSTKQCEEFGTPIDVVIDAFRNDYEGCSLMVAHKIEFDVNIISAEMERLFGDHFMDLPAICTKEYGYKILKVKDGDRPRRPSLRQLYEFLFNTKLDVHHDGLADANTAMECFFELIKRGVIQLDALPRN